jgi:hypothetical protein
MRRFYLDIDDDKVPDLFLGANALFGNADRIFGYLTCQRLLNFTA